MPYWFNVTTGEVQTDESRGQDADVLGPYATQEEAAGALAKAKERSDTWDDEDREWNAKGASGSTGSDATAWSDEDLED